MHRAKISIRAQREEFTTIAKDYTYTDFSVEKYPTKESAHVIGVISKYAEADA